MVGPKEQQSGTGIAIDADRIFQPIETVNIAPNKWFVDATPVVTTQAGLDFILDGEEPDLVISGINERANIGTNIAISSGTVSAATTAIRRGIPAIAVSAGGSDEEATDRAYTIGSQFVVDAIDQLIATQTPGEELLPEGVGLNINIPGEFPEGIEGVRDVAFTRLDETTTFNIFFGELPSSFGEGAGVLVSGVEPIEPSAINDPTSEGEQFLSGAITVTPIDGNWSSSETVLQNLSDRFAAAPANPTVTPLNILITNDDGFDAPGIAVWRDALIADGHNVTLVAPKEQQSGQGTRLDVNAILQPVEISNFSENEWFVDSSPRTVTWAALDFILADQPPDLVISGINEGQNIGPGGAVSSGTVSAAVTALLRGVPSIAYLGEDDSRPSTEIAYQIGADFVANTIAQLQATQGSDSGILPPGTALSVNIPVDFPEGVEEIQGAVLTLPDAITPLEITFGPLPENFGGGVGLGIATTSPDDITNIPPLSEGGQFLSGFITVSPLDGDWTAPDDLRLATSDRLAALNVPQLPDTAFDPVTGISVEELYNDEFYLSNNPSVASAVNEGTISDGLTHFLQFGQAEGRDPSIFFNTDFYLANNIDVATAIAAGETTAVNHFVNFGESEGRSPSASFDEGFYLENNPDVSAAVAGREFGNGLQHFVLFGENENRLAVG